MMRLLGRWYVGGVYETVGVRDGSCDGVGREMGVGDNYCDDVIW